MNKKKISELTIDDLHNNQVWEHWTQDNIEYVKPMEILEISEESNITYIVLTEYQFNNGSIHMGYCSPQDTSGIDYIQPVIFTNNSQVELFRHEGWPESVKDEALRKLGLNWEEIFPVNFKTRISCDGEFYSSRMLDFNIEV